MSEIPKQLHFDSEGREKLMLGIEKISRAVKSTLGPSGQTVLIESEHHTHGITVTKDGVTVAKSIILIDPVENLAVRIMKQAAERTGKSAGDGTTTAIVLTEALVKAGMDEIDQGCNKTETFRELVELTKVVCENLKESSRKVSGDVLKYVAKISANNDDATGQLIADVYSEIGVDGIVTVNKSATSDTYYEVVEGMKFKKGYSSHYFINEHEKDECIMEDVYVLVSEGEISNVVQLSKILEPIVRDGKKLLIIAPCSNNVTNTLAANKVKNGIHVCVVQPPMFGHKQHELMSDIALKFGATHFSEKTGDDMSILEMSDLGKAKKIVVDRDSTILISSGEFDEKCEDRSKQLKKSIKNLKIDSEIDFVRTRISALTGSAGAIFVGGQTDLEQKELYDRVDDAVCAVRSALEEGIVPGGGIALFNECRHINLQTPAGMIMFQALQAPIRQLFENAGMDFEAEAEFIDMKKGSHGKNIKTGEFGDMYELGVIDPLKVTRSALENAVSVAVTILSTNAIVTMARAEG